VSFFKQSKPKRFNYIPRNERDVNSRSEKNLKSKWDSMRSGGKRKSKSKTLPILLVILGMIIAFWYVLTHYETA